jgi:hypothetical protein
MLALAYAVLSTAFIAYITRPLPPGPRALGLVGGVAMQLFIAYIISVLPTTLARAFFAANVACWVAILWSERAYGIGMLGAVP